MSIGFTSASFVHFSKDSFIYRLTQRKKFVRLDPESGDRIGVASELQQESHHQNECWSETHTGVEMLDKDLVKKSAGIQAYFDVLPDLQKTGSEYRATCRFHADSHPSLVVNLKGDTFLWKCHPCDVGGDIFSLIQKMDGCDFPTALRKLAERFGIEDSDRGWHFDLTQARCDL